MKKLSIYPPLIGAVSDIGNIPDPVFANKLVGNGVAIEPFNQYIYAPIDGVIKSIHKAKHAITLVGNYAVEVLIHIGLETVGLNGDGFTLKVKPNDAVKQGDILGEFDIDFVSIYAKSLISPVLVIDPKKYKFDFIKTNVARLDNPLFTVEVLSDIHEKKVTTVELVKSNLIEVTNNNGIHARPAALIGSKARGYGNDVLIEKNGRQANAKSIIELLSLSVVKGDKIYIYAENSMIIAEIENIINQFRGETEQINQPNIHDAVRNMGKVEGTRFYGAIASDGICIGHIVKNHSISFEITEESKNNPFEQSRFLAAVNKVKFDLEQNIAQIKLAHDPIKDILSAHLVLLTDPHLLSETIRIIKQNKTAEFAITKVINNECQKLLKTGNQLLIERQADFRDIYNRILMAMDGVNIHPIPIITTECILVADELTPSDVLNLDTKIIGLISIKGGTTSHVAVLSRAKQIPLLVGVNSRLLNLDITEEVILDAKNAWLNIAPTLDEIKQTKALIKQQLEKSQLEKAQAKNDALTLDQVKINCMGNIANPEDAKLLSDVGSEGVGLFRTEFIYMDKDEAPNIETQYKIYSSINKMVGNHPFIIRTLDAGGEKPISYLHMQKETNPVLGVRGIRLCLEHKEIFANQLISILKLNNHNVKIMLPMISTIEEYRQTYEFITDIKKQYNITNYIELGIMVEVPSVALQSDIFAKEVDFFSIGTNDLTQYTLAIDREHAKLAHQADHLHPAVLRNINLVVTGATKYNKPVSVCGMMASEKYAIPILIGLGITNFSMNLNSIPENKTIIRKLDTKVCRKIANHCLNLATAVEVRNYVTSYFINIFN